MCIPIISQIILIFHNSNIDTYDTYRRISPIFFNISSHRKRRAKHQKICMKDPRRRTNGKPWRNERKPKKERMPSYDVIDIIYIYTMSPR